MKKKNKLGFSLAEVLIALGIISIIATMGMSISRKGVEKAYNMYVYNSYKGISDAFESAILEGAVLDYNAPFAANTDNDAIDADFGLSILQSLSASNVTTNNNKLIFDTPNNVKYEITKSSLEDDSIGHNEGEPKHSGDPRHKANYVIKVTIPKRKVKNDTTHSYCLVYTTNSSHGLFIPVNSAKGSDDNVICSSSITLQNLATRQDLLPFFIDNGSVGRRVPSYSESDANNNNIIEENEISITLDYTRRIYRNLKDTYHINCSSTGADITSKAFGSSNDKIAGRLSSAGCAAGAIILANPRNL